MDLSALFGHGRSLRLSAEDLRHHVLLLGPTGAGKTTVMEQFVLDAVVGDRSGGLLIDPKDGSAVRHVLERIPRSERDRVVVLDPAGELVPGLNPLECPDPGMRELAAEAIVSTFARLFSQHWQHRQDRIMRAAVLTLLEHEGTTLLDIPVLLTDAKRRAELTADVANPVLRGVWKEYDQMGASARSEAIGPLLSKLEGVLLRGSAYRVLGQPESTLDIDAAVDGRAIVLADFAKGRLGDDTSALLGSLLVARVWLAVLRRASQPEERRQPFVLALDEFQNHTRSFGTLQEALAESRSLGIGWILACQHRGQLSKEMQAAVEANCRTRMVFAGPDEDLIPLGGRHRRHLRRFEAAFQPRLGKPRVIRTRPRPRRLHDGRVLARWSAERFGMPRAIVDAELAVRGGD